MVLESKQKTSETQLGEEKVSKFDMLFGRQVVQGEEFEVVEDDEEIG